MSRKPLALCAMLIVCLPLLLGAAAPIAPTTAYYVNDAPGLISNDSREFMQQFSEALEQSTGSELVVLVVESTDGMDIDSYAAAVFAGWEIGGSSGNGVLILCVSTTAESRILAGAALDEALDRETLDRINSEKITPSATGGSPSAGVYAAYRAVAILILEHFELEVPEVLLEERASNPLWSPATLVIFAILIFLTFRSTRISRRYQERANRSARKRREFSVKRGDDEEYAPKTPRQAEIERLKRIQLEEREEYEREQAAQAAAQDDSPSREDPPPEENE